MFLTGITFAFIQAPTLGWSSPTVLAMAVAGALGLAAFLVRDHTAASPMLPLGVFRERQFAATNAVTFIVDAALTGATFLLPIQLQVVSDYSPLASGLALVPLTLIMLALSARSGIASAVNNDVARFGGLLAVAVLPALAGISGTAYLHPDALAAGFRTAVLISAALCAAGGLLAAFTITNPPRVLRPAGVPAPEECLHCGLEAPPLTTSATTS